MPSTSPLHLLTPKLESLLSWGLPPLIIPLLRWFQDPPELRWKLFTRDFTTYSIGTCLFLGGRSLLRKALKGFIPNEGTRELSAFLIALGGNLAFAGIGALKISKWIEAQWHQILLQQQAKPQVFPPSFPLQPSPFIGRPAIPGTPLYPWPPINIINVVPKSRSGCC